MKKKNVILIFDVGKTNKKILLFDEYYKLVHEESTQLPQINDEDGFPCEDVNALTSWVKDSFDRLSKDKGFDIRGVNFSAYGASFVYLDEDLQVFLPLYNYLKPYPPVIQKRFYDKYGGEAALARQTASPVLGSLNSGMQLYRLQQEWPETFDKIKWALHLPQYLSYLLSSSVHSDITSIGCHTLLWNFQNQSYHQWVGEEGIEQKLAPFINARELAGITNDGIPVGVGLHDSSAALIPYLALFSDPFILLSTGTWCISLNPFNHARLTNNELNQDCLCYLSWEGRPVKASRLFAGYEHELQEKRLAEHFNTTPEHYKNIDCDLQVLRRLADTKPVTGKITDAMVGPSGFHSRDLDSFADYGSAYHQLIADIVQQQVRSTNLVLKGTDVKRIFVDGGFSTNQIFMHLLAEAFPGIEVYAASVPQASALGAALAIHSHWNSKPMPRDIIELKYYAAGLKTQGVQPSK